MGMRFDNSWQEAGKYRNREDAVIAARHIKSAHKQVRVRQGKGTYNKRGTFYIVEWRWHPKMVG